MADKYEKFGKYILLEKLATGGMAEVFLARSPFAGGIGKLVALKRILPQFSDYPEYIEMFKDEAKIAINLSHSNIVSIYEFGIVEDQLYLVMDYVEGRNLRQILNKMKKESSHFAIDQIAYMIKEVAGGLDHAHRCLDGATGKPLNITHRDMSPQNIMLSFEGEVNIVDFGIAKAETQLESTRVGTLKGKFGYMSPEQAEGKTVDLRTDIFSLGIVFWELLANERLFLANNEINTLRKIRDCQVPSLRKINPNIHPELERITQKVLARDRNLRYQTAAALHRDLNRFLNRQYPDFSSHDFSIFVKTLYADDILETRKRVIRYSSVLTSDAAEKPSSVRGDFTNTDLVQPRKKVRAKRRPKLPPPPKKGQGINEDSFTGSSVNFDSTSSYSALGDATEYETNNSSGEEEDDGTKSEVLAESGLNKAASLKAGLKKSDTNSQKGVINEGSLKDMDFGISMAQVVNPDGSYDISPEPLLFEDTNFQRRVIRRPHQSRGGGLNFLSLITIFSILIISYIFVERNFPDEMSGAKKVFDGVFGSNQVSQSSEEGARSKKLTGKKVRKVNSVGKAGLKVKKEPKITGVKSKSARLIINSNPSGAEIYVNGRYMSMVTPAPINVIKNQAFAIELKKDRYATLKRSGLKVSKTGTQMTFGLKKAALAYLDVIVRPSRNAQVYINNKKLGRRRKSYLGVPVPANETITVYAVNPYSGRRTATKKLKLKQSERKRLVLQLERK